MCLMSYTNNKDATKMQISLRIRLDSVMSLVSVTKISNLMLASVAELVSLSLTWSQTPKTRFLMTRLKCKERVIVYKNL